MDSLNNPNHSKTLTFEEFKRLLYKHYPTLVKGYTKQPKRLDKRQFLVLLYDRFPKMKHVLKMLMS